MKNIQTSTCRTTICCNNIFNSVGVSTSFALSMSNFHPFFLADLLQVMSWTWFWSGHKCWREIQSLMCRIYSQYRKNKWVVSDTWSGNQTPITVLKAWWLTSAPVKGDEQEVGQEGRRGLRNGETGMSAAGGWHSRCSWDIGRGKHKESAHRKHRKNTKS